MVSHSNWNFENCVCLPFWKDHQLPQKLCQFPSSKNPYWSSGLKVKGQTEPCHNASVWKRIGVNSEFHIPIPILWNWFLECPNSNSSSGIVASTPIPTQWNWGDSTGIPISKFPTLCSPLKRRKRQLETPSSLLFSNFFSFSKGYRVWEILKSESQWNLPNSVESELELQLQFQVWNWNGGSIQFQNSPMELELELTELFHTLQLTSQDWVRWLKLVRP